jgi:cGMP-dependent protein kinase
MILAVEYLHKKRIVYRDIKPENIMIDEMGYLKLIDMGTAKILKVENGICRTNTILGTPHYMAPEILKHKGYGLNVDLWSIGSLCSKGITLYEFMCGLVPFGDDCEEPNEVYELIDKQKLAFPPYFDNIPENKPAKSFIEQLLNRSPEARLGGSYAALKAHKWFEKFDWVGYDYF